MKICKLIIRGFQQFENTELDFTDPVTGEPADRICLIGRNGTGKSTILRILDELLDKQSVKQPISTGPRALLAVKVKVDTRCVYMVACSPNTDTKTIFLKQEIENVPGWADEFVKNSPAHQDPPYWGLSLSEKERPAMLSTLSLLDNGTDLVIYAPSETPQNTALAISDLPDTNLDKALALFKSFPAHHVVSNETIAEMWRVLVYLVKKRDNDRDAFENREENLHKTKAELIAEFDRMHPRPLVGIASLWNKILDRAGLELDVEGADNPIQLNDNLQAYIRLKSNKLRIAYNQLSTGMRDFLFRLGHIYLLYFGRNIERGFLLVDEPENSLFPDFLFDLMETYNRIVQNGNGVSRTQMFFATHSPIVAAQFHPYERIVLEWDDFGHVIAKKGCAPIGDDPNDLLRKDFELTHLMGKEGEAKWNEYVDLKKKIRHSGDKAEKDDLIARALEIGQSYGFSSTLD
jgi:energy-coupling factor transporter ATP-binding protein EcfA2